jgi:GTP cyclohydrolase I
MAMRGIRSEGLMTSSVMTGRFREDHNTRAEFLRLSEAK